MPQMTIRNDLITLLVPRIMTKSDFILFSIDPKKISGQQEVTAGKAIVQPKWLPYLTVVITSTRLWQVGRNKIRGVPSLLKWRKKTIRGAPRGGYLGILVTGRCEALF